MNFLKIGSPANFIITKDDVVKYVIVNGFLQNVNEKKEFKGNGIIYR